MLTAVLSVLVTTTVVLHHAPMSCRHDFPSSSPELCGVAGVIIVVTAGTQQGPRCPAPPSVVPSLCPAQAGGPLSASPSQGLWLEGGAAELAWLCPLSCPEA